MQHINEQLVCFCVKETKKVTKLTKFTVSASILGYEIKVTFHLSPSVLQHLLCDKSNSIMDCTIRVAGNRKSRPD